MSRCVVVLVALMLALVSCLRSPALGRACAPRIHGSRASRLLSPRAGIFDDLREEAKDSWLAPYLPGMGDAARDRSRSQEISEQPVLFTKVDLQPRSRPALARPRR